MRSERSAKPRSGRCGTREGADQRAARWRCVDGAAARGSYPQVTGVDLRAAEYGRACAALLSDLLSGTAQPGAVRRHDWALRIRASTAGRG
ncbi:hypothetical protein ACWEQL_11560 [Kitasatospora sp. NPDC004240]